MVEEIKKILKSLEGTVVAFGFKGEKFSSILNSNNKIISFDITKKKVVNLKKYM